MNRKIEKAKKKFQRMTKKIWRHHRFRQVLLCGGLTIIGLAASFFVFNLVYQDKILPRTYIGGINFGGMKASQAKEKLNRTIIQSQNAKLSYTWQQKTYGTDIIHLEVNYSNSVDSTVDDLMAVGRIGTLGQVISETLRSIVSKNNVQASFRLNSGKLNDYLASISSDIDKPEKDATIEIRNDGPVVIPEQMGQKFEMAQNQQIILDHLGRFDFPANLPFEVSIVNPKITVDIAQAAIPETIALMHRQLSMQAANKTFKLLPEDIVGLIEFVARPATYDVLKTPQNAINLWTLSPEISPTKIQPFIDKIAEDIYQEAKDPQFEVKDGRVAAFQIAQTGYELDKIKATDQIIQAIQKDQENLDLAVKITEPAITSNSPEKMGLKELIGEGQTSWRGSPRNRIHNLTLGASKISGSIVKPGEEFSTVKAISPIDAAAGFLPELVIKNSIQVTPEIGGGLCQVSTTLFRAVLNSGLKITARTPHSFRVSYYEPPVGMDATLYDPAPDFRFINNMQTPIFIWAVTSQNSLSFQIYGTKDGRKIEISDPSVYDYTYASNPIYTESDSLGPGEIRQVERATGGATASFSYKVISASSEVLQSETYVSKYVPIPDSYLYGPGTEGIPGQEVPQVQADQTEAPAPEPESQGAPTPTTEKKAN